MRSTIWLNVCAAVSLLPLPMYAQSTKENADFKLAINLYNDGLYDLAAEQLRQFIATYSGADQSVEARFYLGLSHLKLGRYDDARMTFQTFALTYQDNPKAPEAWLHVGESYAAVKNFREAALAFERAKVFHPKSRVAAEALLKASRYFSLVGEPANARRVLRIIIQEYPSSPSVLAARAELGRLYFEEGNLDQAQNELKRVIDGDPSPDAKAHALLVLGNIHQSTGRDDIAQNNYQEIITKHKTTSAVQAAYLNIGRLFVASGKFMEGIDSFKKAIGEKASGDSSLVRDALISAGDAYVELKDYTNAVSYYNRFMTSFPGDSLLPGVLWKSARVNNKARNFKRSSELCVQILRANAKEGLKRRAHLLLALNARDQKNPQQAVEFFASWIDQYGDDPTAPEIVVRTANTLEQDVRDLRKAASHYEMLMTRYSGSSLVDDAFIGAARCYEQLKEHDRSLKLYRGLVERFPASEFRPQAEERIRMIETFEAKEKDAGLEKLALLLGDVVAEKDRVGLAFRLGEIYFNDLKNYQAAAAQFTSAINSGIIVSRFMDALYLRAKSYEYASLKDESFRQRALESYRAFLESYPSEDRSREAALAVFNLSATSLDEARAAYAATIRTYPKLSRDEMLLRIGLLQQEAGMTDSALTTFRAIAGTFPSTPSGKEAAFRIVQIFKELGRVDSAYIAGVSYIDRYDKAPNSAQVLDWTGEIALQSRDRRAPEFYKKLLDNFGYTRFAGTARTNLAKAYLATGMHEEAIELLNNVIAQQSANPLPDTELDYDLELALARAYQASGNTGEAKKHYLQFLAHERTGEHAGYAYSMLGMIHRNEGALALATSYFRQASIVSPEAGASRDIAELLFDSGNYEDAIRQYTRLAESTRDEQERLHFDSQVIIARLRSNQLQEAERGIGVFVKKHKNVGDHIATFELEKGTYHYRRQDYANARKSFDLVVKKHNNTQAAPEALYWTGKTLEATGKMQESLKLYERLMKEYPKAPILPRVYLALGNIHYNMEKWSESAQYYRRIVDNPNPDPALLPFAMSNLIETYEAAGVFDAALAITRKYLETYPNNEDAFDKRIKIGILYQRLGYNDQSVAHLQDLLDEAGSDLEGEIRYYIAEANFNKGDFQQAILDFLKVPYLVTKRGKIDWTANSLYMSGQSYERMGRYDQALTMYQQIVERSGIDETFKAAARKEIDRVKLVLKKQTN